MINTSAPRSCTTAHEPWCDRDEHARYAADCAGTDMEPHCIGRYLEHERVSGYLVVQDPWRQTTALALDSLRDPVELAADAIPGLLRLLSTPQGVEDLRAVLTRAAGELQRP